MRRKPIKGAVGSAWVEGRHWRLADEVAYLQRRAALHDGRFVSVGPLALFSTDTGDAWLLDPSERLATRLALVFDIVDVALINNSLKKIILRFYMLIRLSWLARRAD